MGRLLPRPARGRRQRTFARLLLLPQASREVLNWIGAVRGRPLAGFWDAAVPPWIRVSNEVLGEAVPDHERDPDEGVSAWETREVLTTPLVQRALAWNHAIALEEGFRINHHKTRIMPRGTRQMVTGLVVNEKPNLKREAYDRLKATLHNCATQGPERQNRVGAASLRAHLAGRIEQFEAIHPARGQRLKAVFDRIVW